MDAFLSHSSENTFEFAQRFGRTLPTNSVICFFGDLAAGKTTFIKGLLKGAADLNPSEVQSPTFAYLNVYEGSKTAFHFDLYRLKSAEEFFTMGFDEYFEAGGICCVEWSERISSFLPEGCIQIFLEHVAENKRLITIKEDNHV